MSVIAAIFVALVSFFLGSIPFGVLISKYIYHIDIRSVGSGNIGTTNAFRAMGKAGGVAVFLLDFGKGLLSGFVALLALWYIVPGGGLDTAVFPGYYELVAIAFFSCVSGHIFSPWLNFKGGKGIAVAVGCLFITFGVGGAVLELSIFAVLVLATRYVSVGSIASAAACPFIALYFFWGHWIAWAFVCAGALLVLWAHRENIGRLIRGEENRIGSKKKA
ncbi:MAG: glycerol-3-phosphate 1-O-acyltransferase PlsY [Eggerthellaceae bacterium]|nr:glycerol-3-phosphate 1-O-acyltransferase PlsY [Eggerthellaceae bacterium]